MSQRRKALAIVEALGLRERANSEHEFIQMANNAVYLAEQLGVETGYEWVLR